MKGHLVEQLYREVQAELEDTDYKSRRHGVKATYSAGCRGPLCRKGNRDAVREKYRAAQEEAGVEVSPMKPRDERIEDPYLVKWQKDYDTVREMERMYTRGRW